MKLWPFFTFYGGKWRSAPHYPAPRYGTIIEPFAGSAGYSVRYADRNIILCERDEVIRALWLYLIRVSPQEILRLPDVPIDGSVNDVAWPCQEAKYLAGFWLNKGMTGPCLRPSKWMRDGWRPDSQWGPAIRERIAGQVERIRHWHVLSDYADAPDAEATWFIDAPYVGSPGRRYRMHDVSYEHLAAWCYARRGQVMVCENEGATWLPFAPFRAIKSTEGTNRTGTSAEVLWMKP